MCYTIDYQYYKCAVWDFIWKIFFFANSNSVFFQVFCVHFCIAQEGKNTTASLVLLLS